MNEGFVETGYGRIHYVDGGAGDVVLLTHSGGASLHQFDANFERLSQNARVIAWDMPGHGDSAPSVRHIPIEGYANAAVELMDILGIDKAHVVGCSVGGLMGVSMVASHAPRVDKLVIVDMPLRTNRWWVDNWAMIEDMFTEVVQPFEKVAPRFKNLSQATFRRWNIDRSKCGARTMMDVLWAAREYDLLAEMQKIDVPVMALLGGAGPVSDCADELRRRLPHGRLEIMDGCGHFPMIDEPEIFDDLLIDFLEIKPV